MKPCIANDTPFGLAAYFTPAISGRVWRVMEALEYGMVGVNDHIIQPRVALSAASNNQASVARDRATVSMNISNFNTASWGNSPMTSNADLMARRERRRAAA